VALCSPVCRVYVWIGTTSLCVAAWWLERPPIEGVSEMSRKKNLLLGLTGLPGLVMSTALLHACQVSPNKAPSPTAVGLSNATQPGTGQAAAPAGVDARPAQPNGYAPD